MSQKWTRAAKRFEASQRPDFKPRKNKPRHEKPPITFASFLKSAEGERARRLIKASGQNIALGCSLQVSMSLDAVVLTCEGLKIVSLWTGNESDRPKKEPVLINVEEALKLLQSYPKAGSLLKNEAGECRETLLVDGIRERLDTIARLAP